jgi:hypothetical protein
MQSPVNVASANPAAQCPPSSPASSKTSELSCADRGLFVSLKYANYCKFVQELASYLPEVQGLATALRMLPLAAFLLQVEVNFKDAIAAHQRGDNEGRDHVASAIVRKKAQEHGFDVTKLKAPDYAKLVRYASLFTILAAEDSLM